MADNTKKVPIKYALAPILDENGKVIGYEKYHPITSGNAVVVGGKTLTKRLSDVDTSVQGKQDNIQDLSTIRSGAAAGATSVQPADISDMETKTHAASTYVRDDRSYRILLQLCAYYLVPEWTYREGGYKKDDVVRCQGRMFQALADTAASPYIAVDDGNGNIVVDDHWNILTTDKVDDENWAHVLGGAPEFNLIQQIANLREENTQLNNRIARIEQFLSTHTFITES